MTTRKFYGALLVLFLASVAGIYVSYTLIQEDVYSTARTLFDYFPRQFKVIPASTWEGAMRLGWFVTLTQIVAGGIAFQKSFNAWLRLLAGLLFVCAVPFDAWTDIVYRSSEFLGNVRMATITTIAFYTFGSEIMQTLSWVVFLSTWRSGIREIMWGAAKGLEGFKSIKGEWYKLSRSARSQEARDVNQSSVAFTGDDASESHRTENNRPVSRPRPRPAPHPLSHLRGVQDSTYHILNRNENVSPWNNEE